MNKVQKFVPKPIAKEGIRFEGKLTEALLEFTSTKLIRNQETGEWETEGPLQFVDGEGWKLVTMEGLSYTLTTEDFIMKGVKDEFYPCKASVIEASYDEVIEPENPIRD